ncbi:hypothetical protein [Streptomyces inhibens]|uniref:hypothetical protein n=1 Tax=Streptomyces inhibens TaxID=2293571 RepID=UPI001EE767E3|nr:hypothetical protein [Streptomyces inhibens]UKY47825.1 hypothetical protein KI385_02580 [Streptomyces inhibens]
MAPESGGDGDFTGIDLKGMLVAEGVSLDRVGPDSCPLRRATHDSYCGVRSTRAVRGLITSYLPVPRARGAAGGTRKAGAQSAEAGGKGAGTENNTPRGRRNAQARTLRIVEEALKSGDGTLRLIAFMGAATCAALTLGGGAWLAGLL